MNQRMTRAQLLRRGAAGASLLTVPGLLAACGGGGGGGEAGGELNDVLNFSNWELYIDTPSTRKAAGLTGPTTLQQFTTKTGIKVNYYEDVNSNPEYFAKVQGRLRQGQGIGRDIIVSTDNDRFLGEYLKNNWVQKLDKSLIPNMKNLIAVQQHPPFDPNRDYTLPWFTGMDGIAWNKDVTGPVTSVQQLLEDPKLKGKVGVWNSMGDTLGLIMLENGDDPAKVTDKTFNAAFNRVKKAADNKQIRQFTGNDYAPSLAKGDLAAAMSWSGDIAQIGNNHIHWNVPDAGGALWTDNMLIPNGGDVYTASVYMNYVYDPKVQGLMEAGDPKRNITGIYYIPPVKGAAEAAKKYDPAVASNPLIFPTAKVLDSVHIFDSKALNNQKYVTQWQDLVSA